MNLFTYSTQDPGERQLEWVGARRSLHGLHQLPGRDVAPGHSGKLLSSIFIFAQTWPKHKPLKCNNQKENIPLL